MGFPLKSPYLRPKTDFTHPLIIVRIYFILWYVYFPGWSSPRPADHCLTINSCCMIATKQSTFEKFMQMVERHNRLWFLQVYFLQLLFDVFEYRYYRFYFSFFEDALLKLLQVPRFQNINSISVRISEDFF